MEFLNESLKNDFKLSKNELIISLENIQTEGRENQFFRMFDFVQWFKSDTPEQFESLMKEKYLTTKQ